MALGSCVSRKNGQNCDTQVFPREFLEREVNVSTDCRDKRIENKRPALKTCTHFCSAVEPDYFGSICSSNSRSYDSQSQKRFAMPFTLKNPYADVSAKGEKRTADATSDPYTPKKARKAPSAASLVRIVGFCVPGLDHM